MATGTRLVIIGPPGSGKGTISQLFEKELGFTHFSVGEILREHIENNDELGHIAKEYINQGELIPNNITINIITSYLRSLEDENIIIDGFPRNKFQTAFLIENFPVQGLVYVDLDDELIIKRLDGRRVCPLCGRSYHVSYNPPQKQGVCDDDGHALEQRKDDKPTVVTKRLQEYKNSIKEVKTIFSTQNIPKLHLSGTFDIAHKEPIVKKIRQWVKEIKK
ncbi:MAG: adenylate kinase family protein [Candidatus Nanoarchaeia archaeon]